MQAATQTVTQTATQASRYPLSTSSACDADGDLAAYASFSLFFVFCAMCSMDRTVIELWRWRCLAGGKITHRLIVLPKQTPGKSDHLAGNATYHLAFAAIPFRPGVPLALHRDQALVKCAPLSILL